MQADQSRIVPHQSGGITFEGKDAVKLYGVMSLKSAIGLHSKTGMVPTRGVTITKMLASATTVTGKPYKGKDKHAKAMADLQVWIDAAKCAMPIEPD